MMSKQQQQQRQKQQQQQQTIPTGIKTFHPKIVTSLDLYDGKTTTATTTTTTTTTTIETFQPRVVTLPRQP